MIKAVRKEYAANTALTTSRNLPTINMERARGYYIAMLVSALGSYAAKTSACGVKASKVIQDLTYTADTPGAAGNYIELFYIGNTAATAACAVAASKAIQDLTYTAKAGGTDGNNIRIDYGPGGATGAKTAACGVVASKVIQDLTYTAVTPGAAGNSITVDYDDDGTAGAEVVEVTGTAIVVKIESGVTTATQIETAINASAPALALVTVAVSGTGSDAQVLTTPTALENGADSKFTVASDNIAITAHGFATGQAVQLSISGGGTLPAPFLAATDYFVIRVDADNLKLAANRADAIAGTPINVTADGTAGETVTVTGTVGSVTLLGIGTPGDPYVILLTIEDGVTTAAQAKAAIDGYPPAAFYVSIAVTGVGGNAQSLITPTALTGGALSKITIASDSIEAAAHGFQTGETVQVSIGAGTLPAPLAAATNYYVIVVDANNFKLAASAADALAGTPIDLTADGTADQTVTITPQAQTVVLKGVGSALDPYVIQVVIEDGVTTAAQVKAAVEALAGAAALVDITVSGVGGNAQTAAGPTALENGADSNVDVAMNTITTSANHGFVTGLEVQLTTTGTLPTGLSLATDYYVIVVDADTIKLATSHANAVAGTAVDITADGTASSTVTVTPTSGTIAAKLQRASREDASYWVDISGSSQNVTGTGVLEWEDTEFMAPFLRVVLTVPAGSVTYTMDAVVAAESPLG